MKGVHRWQLMCRQSMAANKYLSQDIEKTKFVIPAPKNRIPVVANRWLKPYLTESNQPGGAQSKEQRDAAPKRRI